MSLSVTKGDGSLNKSPDFREPLSVEPRHSSSSSSSSSLSYRVSGSVAGLFGEMVVTSSSSQNEISMSNATVFSLSLLKQYLWKVEILREVFLKAKKSSRYQIGTFEEWLLKILSGIDIELNKMRFKDFFFKDLFNHCRKLCHELHEREALNPKHFSETGLTAYSELKRLFLHLAILNQKFSDHTNSPSPFLELIDKQCKDIEREITTLLISLTNLKDEIIKDASAPLWFYLTVLRELRSLNSISSLSLPTIFIHKYLEDLQISVGNPRTEEILQSVLSFTLYIQEYLTILPMDLIRKNQEQDESFIGSSSSRDFNCKLELFENKDVCFDDLFKSIIFNIEKLNLFTSKEDNFRDIIHSVREIRGGLEDIFVWVLQYQEGLRDEIHSCEKSIRADRKSLDLKALLGLFHHSPLRNLDAKALLCILYCETEMMINFSNTMNLQLNGLIVRKAYSEDYQLDIQKIIFIGKEIEEVFKSILRYEIKQIDKRQKSQASVFWKFHKKVLNNLSNQISELQDKYANSNEKTLNNCYRAITSLNVMRSAVITVCDTDICYHMTKLMKQYQQANELDIDGSSLVEEMNRLSEYYEKLVQFTIDLDEILDSTLPSEKPFPESSSSSSSAPLPPSIVTEAQVEGGGSELFSRLYELGISHLFNLEATVELAPPFPQDSSPEIIDSLTLPSVSLASEKEEEMEVFSSSSNSSDKGEIEASSLRRWDSMEETQDDSPELSPENWEQTFTAIEKSRVRNRHIKLRKLIREMKKDGWKFLKKKRGKGSHSMAEREDGTIVTIPRSGGMGNSLKPGTFKSIMK